MNTTTNVIVYFPIDFPGKKIYGTAAAFKRAGKVFGPEYEELAAKIAAHPDFKLVIKEQKHHTVRAKRTYDGMNFKFMEQYINTLPDAEKIMKEYVAMKDIAKKSGEPKYPMTKKWFLNKFSSEDCPFDMEEAKRAIFAYNIALAEKLAD